MMTLVPFNNAWAETGSKLDIHGVYQRGEVVMALPLRRHHYYSEKGWRYVSLATGEDINKVADGLRYAGVDMAELSKSYLKTGLRPFDVAQYLHESPQRESEEESALEARLTKIKDTKAKKGKA